MFPDSIHPENKHAFYHLEICCRYVGEKYGHPVISGWTNRDYIILSSVLSRQTNVQISPNTLKRIFGKLKTPDRYYPQKATRDTLARYAGYADWEKFVQQHPRPEIPYIEVEKVPAAIVQDELPVTNQKPQTISWWLIVLPVVILAGLLIFISSKDKETPPVINGAELICSNPEGTNPHSAIFRLKLPPDFNGQEGNFFVKFGDGRSLRPINTLRPTTHYYEIPGRYYAVLLYNKLPIDTVPIYLKTDGWTATANMQSDTVRVYPLPEVDLLRADGLHVNTGALLKTGVDTGRTFFVHFVNAIPMGISGDNFELSADLITSADRPGVRCSQVNITVFGEKSRHIFRVMKPGCASFNGWEFSENILNGESEDLSSLSRDLSKGGNIRLRVKDKNGTLWINGRQVFQSNYKTPIGNIYGIEILFSGIGKINSVILKDLMSGKSHNDTFADKLIP